MWSIGYTKHVMSNVSNTGADSDRETEIRVTGFGMKNTFIRHTFEFLWISYLQGVRNVAHLLLMSDECCVITK